MAVGGVVAYLKISQKNAREYRRRALAAEGRLRDVLNGCVGKHIWSLPLSAESKAALVVAEELGHGFCFTIENGTLRIRAVRK
jgi:hypothetical protein